MADDPVDDDDDALDDEPGLNLLERLIAGLVGLGGVGVGGVGIFLSDNQAGTSIIMILGAAFLVMAVQGTPIIKASKDSFELGRRKAVRRTVRKVKDEFAVKGPEAARAVIEGAVAARPDIGSSESVRRLDGRLYDAGIKGALEEAWQQAYGRGKPYVQQEQGERGYGFLVSPEPDMPGLFVETVITSRGINRATHLVARKVGPTLLVCQSAALMLKVQRVVNELEPSVPVRVIKYESAEDLTGMVEAIKQLRSSSVQ